MTCLAMVDVSLTTGSEAALVRVWPNPSIERMLPSRVTAQSSGPPTAAAEFNV